MSLDVVRRAFEVGRLQVKFLTDICKHQTNKNRLYVYMQESNSWYLKSEAVRELRQSDGAIELAMPRYDDDVEIWFTLVTNSNYIVDSINTDLAKVRAEPRTCQGRFSPAALQASIVRGLRDHLVASKVLMIGQFGPTCEDTQESELNRQITNSSVKPHFDDMSGEELDPELVRLAKLE